MLERRIENHFPAVGIRDLRAFLRGGWSLARLIIDRRSRSAGTMVGYAQFTNLGPGLAYEERGCLSLAPYRGIATRHYGYAFPEPQVAQVTFADGRHFYPLDLTAGQWEATHLCGNDRYEGRFTVDSDGDWTGTWTITGPRKDLTIETRYLRCS